MRLSKTPKISMFNELKFVVLHIPRLRPNSKICSKLGSTMKNYLNLENIERGCRKWQYSMNINNF